MTCVKEEGAPDEMWFPDVDELFGFDAAADGGEGGVTQPAPALRCDGGGAWRDMRAKHPDAATRLGFVYSNTPPTAVAAAALRMWWGHIVYRCSPRHASHCESSFRELNVVS